jgi:MoaA/NifB/PqqE/SkfB family radical SAM enzyme
MIDDQPHVNEIENMINFCNKFTHIYIYGCGENQEYLLKFLDMCNVKVDGYIVSSPERRSAYDESNPNNPRLAYRKLPIFLIEEVPCLSSSGILLALSEKHCPDIVSHFKSMGFDNYFSMSEYNKRTISHKMRPRSRERMWIEVNLADHCNLNCQMCDHYSQIAEPTFLDIDVFRRDMERLAYLSNNHLDILKLQGGEPLLHKDLNEFIKITRELFPRCRIFLFTNGLLLLNWEKSPHGNLWEVCWENNVEIQLTTYPIPLKLENIEKKAMEYGLRLAVFGNVADRKKGLKFSVKHPFDLNGRQEKYRFISCYQFNEAIALNDGKLYTCPMIPYIDHFNKAFNQNLIVSEEDYIDIYKARNYFELADFVTKRVPFCRYCAVQNRSVHAWKQSVKELGEYIDG